ncbi:hypothetical protein CcaverHIS002_0307080 [Cutaneotrichosporon cavernicola]|uniref:Transcription factor CBF/NF-Y/archaeal histone domain-containing protein n=1 Tax=Cutaneotrichosporon cavernicola TaxID=279322 RepID=A0AA48I6J7_9TREE|nr:uncharacterized protein CcaverHIS019_0306990 [Cutaneotrichosporon cavernicola]BEI82840.1 hypothetical protein CcaverHIS002_0307080 [Cutaneotrichosporon cavernicola]BEI90629.1 hypothetical protein CcaverHIS019_0306990 [Cutaneotrichosporon cavernicola]BEI98407.1 hypothetical protein CcaverHIS631_0307060 [Cutaneotrichosporon cavernicola]BEJ06180.1 hypothetical protein CcaverHIS641_0307020 [Cutaneotrichosporon cavernicola]
MQDSDDHPPAERSEDGAEVDAPVKKKRIIKSRQSLAEKEVGTTMFPIARVKRIIKSDKDLDMMSAEATFLISVATEYFVKHFMEEGYTKARLEKRRIISYKDMANVVSRTEEFDFLKDVIPLPVTMSEALERRKAKLVADESAMMHEDDQPRDPSEPAGVIGDSLDLSNAPEDLPPLALSTNPLFPNAIVKRPPNTHARSAVSQPSKPAQPPPPPAPPRVHTGKNAPTTPHALATRSSRRSMNAAAAEPMQID